MHVLYVHQNFPAQFGHIADYLVKQHGFECTFVSHSINDQPDGVRLIRYRPRGGATARTHYCARTFENAVAHAHGVYDALKAHPEVRPDLIVGHSGFGSTLFLRELYDCPVINYFEYYYGVPGTDMDFRPEFPPAEIDRLRAQCRNAMILLDLESCRAGYSPTHWQRSLLPETHAGKLSVIFDGIDPAVWHRHEGLPREVAGRKIGPGTRVVTYVSRGFESMRGFDVFMKVARRIYQEYPDVLFVVVGSDRVSYGGDLKYIEGRSFREHVLRQGDYDLSRFLFTGPLPKATLARVLSFCDVHVYLTVPFVLSWSLFNALACGCTVVASETAPVREVIRHEHNGLLAGFFDVDGLAEQALRVLRDPADHRHLGAAGADLIHARYTLEQTLPRMLDLYQSVVAGGSPPARSLRAVRHRVAEGALV